MMATVPMWNSPLGHNEDYTSDIGVSKNSPCVIPYALYRAGGQNRNGAASQ